MDNGQITIVQRAMSVEKHHLLVVDDDTRLRNLLQQYLLENNFYISVAKDTLEATAAMEKYRFDLIILDVMLPDENGFSFAEKLRSKEEGDSTYTPILFLSAMSDTADKIKGLELGADDYLTKPFEPKELLLRINNVIQRSQRHNKALPQKNHVIKFGDFTFDTIKRQLKHRNEFIALTDVEKELLSVFSRNLGKILTREDLIAACGQINERSIDVRITRLRKKIETNSKHSKCLQTIRNKGYILYE